MSDPTQREWRFYLDDMIAFAEKVIVYTQGLDQAGFVGSGLNYDATVRNLELIGEAATHIPDEIHRANPQIPWRLIVATRNRCVTIKSACTCTSPRGALEWTRGTCNRRSLK